MDKMVLWTYLENSSFKILHLKELLFSLIYLQSLSETTNIFLLFSKFVDW